MGAKIREIIMSIFSIAFKVVIVVISAMFIYKYALVAFDYGQRIFSEEPMSSGEGRKVNVTIGSDMDVSNIGQLLENKGLIRDAKLFILQERLSECHGKIQPGEYELSTAMTAEEMMIVMSDGYIEPVEEEEMTGNSNPFNQDEEEFGFESEDEDFAMDVMSDDLDEEDTAAVEGYAPMEEEAE